MRLTIAALRAPPGPRRSRRSGLRLAALLAALACPACAKSDARWIGELADEDPFVRALAAIALSRQAPERGALAVPVLLETIDRVELELRPQAETALARIGPLVVDELLAVLARDEFMTLDRKQTILATLCAAGPRAVPSILAAIRGEGRERAGELAVVLVRIGEPSVGPLTELLANAPDARLCGYAAWLLGELGPRARAALPALRSTLAHPDPSVARDARAAIARIEGRSSAAPDPVAGDR